MAKTRLSAAAIWLALTVPAAASPLLNPVFQDHAVLQRDQPIRLWGTTAPGATVTTTIRDRSASATADSRGHWQTELPALAAGGPYAIAVKSGAGETQTVSDILIGDVYLCSGQSNMAMPVMGAVDAGPDIQVSANDRIRLMTVVNRTSPVPLATLPAPGPWAAAAPATVAPFSAACYFFARDLQKSVSVPLGLISAPWSGANITSFMGTDALRAAGGEDVRLDALQRYAADPAAGLKHWGDVIEAFWRSKYKVAPWSDPAVSANWPLAPDGLGVWTEWNIPAFKGLTGHVWFRTQVTLTAAQAAQVSDLSLGTLTEEDQTWVNGKFLAATFGYAEKRLYAVPAGMLHEGVNDILINDYCGWRGCGLFGPPGDRAVKLKDGTAVPLSGPWRYDIVPASFGTSPRVPWGATAGISVAYNAMIAPLGPLGLKGVLWYQGESNTGTPQTYRGLTKAWMAGWRAQFQKNDLPFLIVQLPDYGQPPFTPEESGWAELREAQRLAVADDTHAALAVTIDIGDHMGLHPGNKQEVGRRLSLAARRLIYRDTTVKSGPLPLRARLDKGIATVTFTGINGKLAAVGGPAPLGFELCDAKHCTFAAAAIKGETVTLAVPKGVQPTRVRYCWADGPVCTLYDTSRIPAVPFELALSGRR